MTTGVRTIAIAAAVIMAGCGAASGGKAAATPTQTGASGTFTLADSGCGYQGVGQVAAGQVTARLANQTVDRAHFDFWFLQAGHDYAEFAAYVNDEGRRLRASAAPLGHPAFAVLVGSSQVEAGATGQLTAELAAGSYGMACIRWKLAGEGPLDMYPAGPLTVTAP